jgi:GntR family transcriptional repressor for pyruvate dehydrogenase complex
MVLDLSPVCAKNLVQETVASLRQAILNGKFAADSTLPSQAELCKALNVSRTVLREAIRILESQGLVQVAQGRLCRVAPPNPDAAVASLRMLMARSEWSLLDLLEVRRPMEIEIAGMAARRRTSEQIERMRQAIADLQKAATLEEQAAADMRFHTLLAEATGNMLFRVVLDVLARLLFESRKHTIPQSGPGMAVDYHTRILNAVEAQDAEAAREQMHRHMAQTRRDLEQEP